MEKVIEPKGQVPPSGGDRNLAVKLVFKNKDFGKKLCAEESQLLNAYIGEILEEVEIEEKRIIAEQRRAAIEVTARKSNEEG